MPYRLLTWLAYACAVHFAFGWILGLSVDEAHYALYAAHPDWSYFDHPPLVGWVQWPLVAIDAPVGLLRLIPEALWALTCVLVFRLTIRISALLDPARATDPDRAVDAGVWAVILLLFAPILHILGIGMVPDTLLMFFSALLMLQSLRIVANQASGTISNWVGLGLILGLAGLSKYTAIFPAFAAMLFLASRFGWRLLGIRGFWLALLLAGLLVSPVFIWNAYHGWISFIYQAKHGAGGSWRAGRVIAFLLTQLLVYGPLFMAGLFSLTRFQLKNTPALLLFFVLPFVIFASMSGGGGSLPHWTSPAWVCLAPFAGVGLASAWSAGRRKWVNGFLVLQGVLCLAGFLVLFTGGLPWVSKDDALGAKNSVTDLYGWDAAGNRASQLARIHRLPVIAVQNWTLASRIAWYARPMPVNVLDEHMDQFSLWFGNLPVGADALLVDWSQMAFKLPIGPGGFASCQLIEQSDVERMGRSIAGFRYFDCRAWGGIAHPGRESE